MTRVLEEFIVEGIKTTIPLHLAVMKHEGFRKGEIDTGFLDRMFPKT